MANRLWVDCFVTVVVVVVEIVVEELWVVDASRRLLNADRHSR